MEQTIGPTASAHMVTETGEAIDTVAEGVLRSLQAEVARPRERMCVMQVARFLGAVISKLADLAHEQELPVPFLQEFFYVLAQDDSDFRSRKTRPLDAPH